MFSRDEKKPAAVSGGFDLNTFTEEHIYWKRKYVVDSTSIFVQCCQTQRGSRVFQRLHLYICFSK